MMMLEKMLVTLGEADRFVCTPDWKWDSRIRRLPDYDIWTIIEGRGTLETSSDTYCLSRGDSFLLRPGQGYLGTHDPAFPLTVLYAHFNFIDEVDQAELPGFYRPVPDVVFFAELHRRLLDALESGSDSAEVWLKALLQEMLRCEQPSVRGDTLTESGKRRRDGMGDLARLIRDNPGAEYDWNRIARERGYSRDHLNRLFREERGTTLHEYLVRMRMEKARSLLITSDLTIGRIADLLGYEDLSYFSRQFKEKIGRAPSDYRSSGFYFRA